MSWNVFFRRGSARFKPSFVLIVRALKCPLLCSTSETSFPDHFPILCIHNLTTSLSSSAMYHKLPPVWSFFLLATTARASAILDFSNAMFNDRTLSSSRLGSWSQGTYSGRHVTKRHNDVLASASTNSSNSTTDHVWIIQDTFDSTNFFECVLSITVGLMPYLIPRNSHFSFYNESDPTQ